MLNHIRSRFFCAYKKRKGLLMLNYVHDKITSIEKSINEQTTRAEVLGMVQSHIGLSDFGLLMLDMPNPEFPRISKILPRMASEEVQKSWTGSSGITLLTQTLDFVRSLSYNYVKYTGNTLEARKILDFGCGYGRIARLMYYFTSEDNFYGMDPWDKSLKICGEDGLTKNFLLSDYLPQTLPAEEKSFDLIFAFSVFTHLSERAIKTNLNTISRYIKPGGLICITIRPVEYWDIDAHATAGGGGGLVERQKAQHHAHGFSFLPHNREPIDGDITYGDASMTLDWLQASFQNLEIAGIDRSLSDPYQIYVFLKFNRGQNR